MKIVNKFTAVLLVFIMGLSVAACGGKDAESTETGEKAENTADTTGTEEEKDGNDDSSGQEDGGTQDNGSGAAGRYMGCWKYDDYPLYIQITADNRWTAVSILGDIKDQGSAELTDEGIHLTSDNGEDFDTYKAEGDGVIADKAGDKLSYYDKMIFLPKSGDELTETVNFPDKFSDFSIRYPSGMRPEVRTDIQHALNFSTIMGKGNVDDYSTILIAFRPIKDYDQYLAKGGMVSKRAMEILINNIFKDMYGKFLIRSLGTDFQDKGSYYSIKGYMWLDGTIYTQDVNEPVRGCMEVRYYGPTGYALVATTVAYDSRIKNYWDICCNMMDSCTYTAGWKTPVKTAPKRPAKKGGSKKSDYGDAGITYYWTDSDGDVWFFNGSTDEYIGPGDTYSIDDDGQAYEANDAGWNDSGSDYVDDYDPWSDAGDGDDAWSDPGDSYDDWSDPGDYGDDW